MISPAMIQPTVPSTRTPGNSLPGSRIWWNEREFVSASVGMYNRVYSKSTA